MGGLEDVAGAFFDGGAVGFCPVFDEAVFAGVEGDDGDSAAGLDVGEELVEGLGEGVEFVIYGDAEGLEDLGKCFHHEGAVVLEEEASFD